MLRLLGILAIAGGSVLSLAALATGLLFPAAWGRDVILISPHATEVVDLNKLSWNKGESVVEIYGIQNGERTRILFADPQRIIVPEQAPSLVLYKVNKQAGENPLQARSVTFVSTWIGLGGAATAAAGIALSCVNRYRRRAQHGQPRTPVAT